MKKNNAAITILVARANIIKKMLYYLYENWNKDYDYPVYIHTFGKIINDKLKNEILSEINNKIKFIEIYPEIPSHISEKDLFYNRTYNRYVREAFSKKRLGYLHMCYYASNLGSFGKKGCMSKDLEKYDYIMKIDDDVWIKSKIEYDLFDILEKYPMATGFTVNKDNQTMRDVRENLWLFYKNYFKKKKIKPIDENLSDALVKDNENVLFNLPWSCGCLELYNIKEIMTKPWIEYLLEANEYGGNYKYRWGDMEIINLFLRSFFKKPICDLDLINKKIIDSKFPDTGPFYYHGYSNAQDSNILWKFYKLRLFLFKYINKKKKFFKNNG